MTRNAKQGPYIIKQVVTEVRSYNPDFGDERLCECGHPYYRHFDTYEHMYACGCKYCGCDNFVEPVNDIYRREIFSFTSVSAESIERIALTDFRSKLAEEINSYISGMGMVVTQAPVTEIDVDREHDGSYRVRTQSSWRGDRESVEEEAFSEFVKARIDSLV